MDKDYTYWDTVTGNRAAEQFREDEQGAMEGRQTISLETQDNAQEANILAYIHYNFESFMRYVRVMDAQDQDALLSYYLVGKNQNQLATLFKSTQTVMSFQLRASVKCLSAIIMWGGNQPTIDQLDAILIPAGVGFIEMAGIESDPPHVIRLSVLIVEYLECRDFAVIAANHLIHRPDIRRTMRQVCDKLTDVTMSPTEQACGWWLFKLINNASASGKGKTKKQKNKLEDMAVHVPDIAGKRVIDMQDEDMNVLFQSHSSL